MSTQKNKNQVFPTQEDINHHLQQNTGEDFNNVMQARSDKGESKAQQYFKSQRKSGDKYENNEEPIPEELFAKKDKTELVKINAVQVEKGLVRLKFKHPLKDSKLTQVFPSLKCFKKLSKMCCRNDSTVIEVEPGFKSSKSLRRSSTFKNLQSKAKSMPGAKKDAAMLRKIINDYHELEGDGQVAERTNDTQMEGESEDSLEEDRQMMDMYEDLLNGDQTLIKSKKKDLNKKEAKKKENKEIFLNYGTGIQNYFIVQIRLIQLFCVLTLLAIPQMLIYRYFNGYNYTTTEPIYASLSFGAMGYTSSNCGTNFINWSNNATQVGLQCQGTTKIKKVIDSGIVDINQNGPDQTLNEFNRCFYEKPITGKYINMVRFDQEAVAKETLSQCSGLQSCKVKLDHSLFRMMYGLQNYDQFVFVQVACEQDEEMLWLKNVMGLCAATLGLAICLVYRNNMVYQQGINLINDKIYDGQLITLGDYSIQGKITRKQYEKFLQISGNDQHVIQQFEVYLMEEISNWLMKEDQNQSTPASTYAIADLQLAFDNDSMMNFLQDRASALRSGNFKKAEQIQEKMTEYKNKNFELLTIPKLFYCTFHHEYAYHKAVELSKKRNFVFINTEINIKEATEPTDIIWENRHIRKNWFTARWAMARICMVILSFFGFLIIIVLLKNKLGIQYIKNPPGLECDNVLNVYGADLQQVAFKEQQQWQKIDTSVSEFDLNKVTSRRGALTCFCSEMRNQGFKSDNVYNVKDSKGGNLTYPICDQWIDETELASFGSILSQGTAQLVVLTSFVLRKVFITLVKMTGFNKNSKEAVATMYSVLVVTFFNYGILYIIAPWSFGEAGAEDGDLFSGIYTDFTSQWFLDIGSLIAQTTAINMTFPVIEFIFFFLIRLIKRMIDQRSLFPCNKYKTTSKTIPQFEALYSGPEFFVHYRLAFIVNIVYVTFLFGPGQPVLFPITLAGLIFTYIVERLRMAYSYQKPPMYDSRLTQQTLNALKYATIFYALSAAWLFSNQQVFRNLVPEMNNFALYPLMGHRLSQCFTQITPGTMFVIYILVLLFLFTIRKLSGRCKANQSVKDLVEDLTVVEALEPFYSMLKTKDREFWFREEVTCRERIGMKRINPRNFLQLVFAEHNKKGNRLRSVHNYDILTNPTYSDKFHYVPCAYEGREQYIISEFSDPWIQQYSTDIVRVVCDLAYLPKSIALNLQFNEVSIFKHMVQLRRNHVTTGNTGGDEDTADMPRRSNLSAIDMDSSQMAILTKNSLQ